MYIFEIIENIGKYRVGWVEKCGRMFGRVCRRKKDNRKKNVVLRGEMMMALHGRDRSRRGPAVIRFFNVGLK